MAIRGEAEYYGRAKGPLSIFIDVELAANGQGYYILDRFGRLYAFGSARHRGDDRGHDASGEAVDLEVTPDGDVVWRFANPDVSEDGMRAPIWRMTRFERGELPFLDEAP